MRRWLALWCLGFAVWVLLSWTRTAEQLIVGVAIAGVVATACAPLGPVAAPWSLLDPRRLLAAARTAAWALVQIVRANLSLSKRIWSPSRPLRPGMVIVPTQIQSEGEWAAIGLVTSLIVDNQLVDLDRLGGEMLFHMVWVATVDPEQNRELINGPLEDRLEAIIHP